MIVNIYITGQIGNTLNEKGEITTRGVTLLDVVEQVAAHPKESIKRFVINSPGGYVSIGNEILNFISNIPNALTHGTGQVASVATKLLLAVPVENRSIEKGTQFTIHNPWVRKAVGDAARLREIADGVEAQELEFEAFYSKATGLDKSTLSSLMSIETKLTSEQCVSLGFVGSVTEKELSPILALNYNQKQEEMTKTEKGIFENILAKLGYEKKEPEVKQNADGRNIVAIMVETDKGVIENDLEDIQVNDVVKVNGEENVTDVFTTEDGVIYEIVDGVVMTITEPEDEDDELAKLKAENEKLKAENESLVEAHKVEIEERDANTAEIKAKIESLALLQSEGEPTEKETVFRSKDNKPTRKSFAEAKEQMKKNK